MKGSNILWMLLFSCFSLVKAQERGIVFFEGDWNKAVELAKMEGKPLFVDCYASWCSPCAYLAKNIFTQEAIGSYFNSRFINLHIDMEKGMGKQLSKDWGLYSYPTLIVFNKNGYKISQITGAVSTDSLLNWSAMAWQKKDSIPHEQLFAQGRKDSAFVRTYFTELLQSGQFEKARLELQKAIALHGNEILLEKPFWDLLALEDIDSSAAIYFVTHKAAFEKRFEKEEVEARIREMYISTKRLRRLIGFPVSKGVDTIAYQTYLKHMQQRGVADIAFLKAEIDFFIACKMGKFDEACILADSVLVNARPWMYYDMIRMANWELRPAANRKHAAVWAEKAVQQLTNPVQVAVSKKVLDELQHRGMGSFYPAPEVWGILL